MSTTVKKLQTSLKPIGHRTVLQLVLLVWPDEGGVANTDIQLNVMTRRNFGLDESFTFGIAADGQTLAFELGGSAEF